MNLDGFTLIFFFFFTDILNQEFNLREKKIYIYNNTLTETINTKNFE